LIGIRGSTSISRPRSDFLVEAAAAIAKLSARGELGI
jgi:hypothetical protein